MYLSSHIGRVANIGLRFGTLGTRFVFVFVLARFLDAASVGYYGLFAATIGLALYIFGFDYYVYVGREMLAAEPNARGRMLKGHMAFSGLFYVLMLPLLLGALVWTNWPSALTWWFIPLLLLEHLNQEISRILNLMARQLSASFLLFLRQGSWAIGIALWMLFDPSARSLGHVFLAWGLAGLAAALCGGLWIARLGFGGWADKVDWSWVKRGLRVSSAFLLATLSARALQTVDRYWLEDLAGIEAVGAYTLFIGMASALTAFMDAGVFAFVYPRMMRLYNGGHITELKAAVRSSAGQVVFVSVIFIVFSWLVLPYLLAWTGKSAFVERIDIYPILAVAFALYSLSLAPHYALYAAGQDRVILLSQWAAVPAFVGVTWAVSQIDPFLAVPIGLASSFLVTLTGKTWAYFRRV